MTFHVIEMTSSKICLRCDAPLVAFFRVNLFNLVLQIQILGFEFVYNCQNLVRFRN